MLFAASLVLGAMFVLPIGGGDMPVVISILNSLTGLAAALTGFVLHNQMLVVAGVLVGASGTLAHPAHEQGDESLSGQRAVWRIRGGDQRCRCDGERGWTHGQADDAGRHGDRSRLCAERGDRAGLRTGSRGSAAHGERARDRSREARGRCQIRDSSRRRPDARAHERSARRRRTSPTTSCSRWIR